MIKTWYIFIFLFAFNMLYAQKNNEVFQKYQDSLFVLQKKMFNSKRDEERKEACTEFKQLLFRALALDKSFDFPFDSLKEISRLYAPDNAFRIINWDIPKNDGTYEYFGYLQVRDVKKKKDIVYELIDKSNDVKNAETYQGTPEKWYGMLYYKIISVKYKRKKYYTLLGKDANDKLTSKKIIDVLFLSNGAAPKFGADIFKLGKKSSNRIVFEYSSQVVMLLNYNEDKKMIVFDHLAPSSPQLESQYQYYGPDFSFDALNFEGGKWRYIPDIDARNPSNKSDNNYNDPHDKTKEKGDGDEKKIYESKKKQHK